MSLVLLLLHHYFLLKTLYLSLDLEEKVQFILFFQTDGGKTASAARNWRNVVPQTDATTFAFAYVSILLIAMLRRNRKYFVQHIAKCCLHFYCRFCIFDHCQAFGGVTSLHSCANIKSCLFTGIPPPPTDIHLQQYYRYYSNIATNITASHPIPPPPLQPLANCCGAGWEGFSS